MTYQTLEKYSYTMERRFDKDTDKSTSNVHSTPTLISQVVQILKITYTYASLAESKETVCKSLLNEKE